LRCEKPLFDHLVGKGEQSGRHRQTKRLGRLQVRPNAGRPKGVPNKTESTDTPPPAAAAE
jgi:hypothetical protein